MADATGAERDAQAAGLDIVHVPVYYPDVTLARAGITVAQDRCLKIELAQRDR